MSTNQPLPTRPLPLPRATTPQQPFQPPPQPQPQQPPQQQPYRQQPPQQQEAEAGTDPAAVIAARSAAVARNRQREARVAMLQDVLRIVFVAVILGGIAWIFFWRHNHNMEEKRQQAEIEKRAQEQRDKEQREREERFAAERKEQQRKKEAEAAEKRRREDEKRLADKKRAEEARQRKENAERQKKAMARFKSTSLNSIVAAPPTDYPEKVTGETWYSCVVPGGPTGVTLYEIKALPGKDIRIDRFDENNVVTNVTYEEFTKVLAKQPCLLAKEGTRCYYIRRGKFELRDLPVPVEGESLDPSRKDLWDLYEFAATHCGKQPALAYEVFFKEIGSPLTRILVVPFGKTISRADVVNGLRHSSSAGKFDERKLQERLNGGRLTIRRKEMSR